MPRSTSYLLLIGLALIASACTLLVELDGEQCETVADCTALGVPTYDCVQNTCQPRTCGSDAGCSSLTDAPLCGDEGLCVAALCSEDGDCLTHQVCDALRCAPRSCTDDAGCGDPNFICQSGMCTMAECQSDSDCNEGRASQCAAGRCVDPVWGCIGMRTSRKALRSDITVRARIEDVISGEMPDDLLVDVCGNVDFECTSPIDASVSLDPEGLTEVRFPIPEAGFDGYLWIRSPSADLYDVYYVFADTPLFEDTELLPIRMFSPGVAPALAASRGLSVEENGGFIVSRVFDCRGEPGEGVLVTVDPPGNTLPFSVDSADFPDVDSPATNEAGLAVIANVAAPTALRLRAVLPGGDEGEDGGDLEIASYGLDVRAGVSTYANIDPR